MPRDQAGGAHSDIVRRGAIPVLVVGTSAVVAPWLDSDDARSLAAGYLAEQGLGPAVRECLAPEAEAAVLTQVRQLSTFLADRRNNPDPAELEDFLERRLDGAPSAIAQRWDDLWRDLDALRCFSTWLSWRG